MAADTLRQECDERIGEYRENGAGKDRDPLQKLFVALLSQKLVRVGRTTSPWGYTYFQRSAAEQLA